MNWQVIVGGGAVEAAGAEGAGVEVVVGMIEVWGEEGTVDGVGGVGCVFTFLHFFFLLSRLMLYTLTPGTSTTPSVPVIFQISFATSTSKTITFLYTSS